MAKERRSGVRGRLVSASARRTLWSLDRARHGARVLAIPLALSSCAAVYTNPDGTKHVVGLVRVSIRPATDAVALAGDVVDVTVLGLGVYSTPPHSGLVLGYSREVTASIRDNALVLGNPLQEIRSTAIRPAALN